MNKNISHRKAHINDLPSIVALLFEDELGKTRENKQQALDQRYVDAFHKIDIDPNQYLMIVENDDEIIGTCHLTIIPSLTFTGQTRMQIEAVRVSKQYRGQKIGEWMMNAAINYGRSKGASIIQLTTNKKRSRAKNFYEKLGFESSHEGMKLYLDKNNEHTF
ncbi:GNAT family N-acetyltransferase [Legionella cincinnatiensis]|uniref:Acetyltransferase n=1 Tax=Legionella cincinnatiensis TaxID=28085 RepID=A0A378II73_9GAMM|nr:GNAT family N-acetyltransferase [Legionella cincinnatiensis]KTC81943.1 aminoalkylphosphonic acid N-acetyltransferase [Legionella cincinnatiensis]STX34723.1 acetyltransferase [Legionella cincinnatiensis]